MKIKTNCTELKSYNWKIKPVVILSVEKFKNKEGKMSEKTEQYKWEKTRERKRGWIYAISMLSHSEVCKVAFKAIFLHINNVLILAAGYWSVGVGSSCAFLQDKGKSPRFRGHLFSLPMSEEGKVWTILDCFASEWV